MPAAWIGAAGAVLGALGGGDSQGGTQTVDKSPWSAAAPWLTQNIDTGQRLQGYYQSNPFNSLQQAAYGNLFAGGDYMNQALPGLLAQLNRPVGFDRSNPQARSQGIQMPPMPGMGQPGGSQPMLGLLGNMNQTQNPFANGGMPAPAPVAAPAQSGWWDSYNPANIA